MRVLPTFIYLCFPIIAIGAPTDMWVGKWVEGERGAHTYNKIRISPSYISIMPGGQTDYFYFPQESSKLWCSVKYEAAFTSQGITYPDQPPEREETTRHSNRTYKSVLLKLEHSKCTNYKYLQMAFLSDLGDSYADIVEYTDKRIKAGSFNFHRVADDRK